MLIYQCSLQHPICSIIQFTVCTYHSCSKNQTHKSLVSSIVKHLHFTWTELFNKIGAASDVRFHIPIGKTRASLKPQLPSYIAMMMDLDLIWFDRSVVFTYRSFMCMVVVGFESRDGRKYIRLPTDVFR